MSDKPNLIRFPDPPHPEAVEWAGSPLGLSNTITRTKSRTAIHDKSIDLKEGLFERLLEGVENYIRDPNQRRQIYEHDVVIHGIKVRAMTNSHHLYDFWVDNWYSVGEWKGITGREVVGEPRVWVYAFGGVKNEKEAAYYSRKKNTIIFFNTSYYGQLKSWVLGAVGRILADDFGIHSIHGACVTRGGKGILYIAPTGTGKSTASYGLMTFEDARFHSDDWVYVRYTFKEKDGRRISPVKIIDDGREVKGYRVYRWLEANEDKRWATVVGRDLGDREVLLTVGDLDLSAPIEAYAFTSEKIFYLRTNLVENFPETTFQMLSSKLENVPDLTPEFIEEKGQILDGLLNALKAHPAFGATFKGEGDEEVKVKLGRLFSFDNARAMLDITKVFEPRLVFTNPMEPARLSAVMLIKRDFDGDVVAESLPLNKFMTRLLIGETPMRTREIAYNAYRAVDDKVEAAYVKGLEEELKGRVNPRLYDLFASRDDVPETLEEEFELFRIMHKAAKCYDLNTILEKDPKVKERPKAVALTMRLIDRVLREEPTDLSLNLKNYAEFAR